MLINRLSWGIFFACVALLFCLLIMAVNRARIAAGKMQSSNNLKQIVLALHNFESAFKRLPNGCDPDAKHGWQITIFPFMEASSWYNELDQGVGWEHPFNYYKFRLKIPSYQRPSEIALFSSEGYSLMHYLGNPSILYRGSQMKFSELNAGLSNIWFAGEIGSRFQPFGYPYNWRDLEWPLNAKDGGFGGWSDGAHFGMGDGAIRFVSSSIDRSVVDRLAQTVAMPEPKQTSIPNRLFECGGTKFMRKTQKFENEEDRMTKGGSSSEVYFDLDKRAEVIVYRAGPGLKRLGIDLDTMVSRYSEARVVVYRPNLNATAAEKISRCKNVEALKVGRVEDTEAAIQILQALSRLKFLSGMFDSDLFEQLKMALPECEISSTGNR